MARRNEQLVTVGGRRLKVTNLDKVMYPETATTKGEVLQYYSEVAEYLLPYAMGRPVTRKRWVDGVAGPVFFQKDLEESAPSWVPRHVIHHKDHDNDYPVLDTKSGLATLAWFAQVAALELHVPQWRFGRGGAPGHPDRMVFDLDPGEGAGLPECVQVAKLVREILDDMGLPTVPVTSGSKGIHIYATLDGRHTSDEVAALAHELAKSLEADHPDLVISTMRKADRTGKVLVDWSQNNAAKTTIAPYSLRGRTRPTVAMPRTWGEITSGRLRQIEMHEVFALLRRRGDAARALQASGSAGTGTGPGTDRLERYREMRDAAKTPEPVPERGSSVGAGSDGMSFVIQRHQARRLHYDFRLEREGVLVSWAVPKGVPELGGRNHLAVHVEDHPLEYGSFQGDIPKGEYGAGHVDIWDHGTYSLEKWRDDEVIATLQGAPDGGLGGEPAKVALIRTGGSDGKSWLLHRMRIEGTPARTQYAPMLAKLGSARDVATSEDVAVEMKWDGVRALAFIREGNTRLISRNDLDMSATYPEFADLAARVDGRDAVLDGEIIAVDRQGYPSFGLLQQRMRLTAPAAVAKARKSVPVRYMLFDILAFDGEDVTKRSYRERRELLEAAISESETVQVPPVFDGTVAEGLARAAELQLEGVVVKDPAAPYYPGRRSAAWTKVKLHRTQEVVIVGWRPGQGSRDGTIGSLLLAVPMEGKLHYVGRVGTGFDRRSLTELGAILRGLTRKTSPAADVPADVARDAHWVSPKVVGEVEYAELTRDGRLRQPTWRGLRPDKAPEDVRAEW